MSIKYKLRQNLTQFNNDNVKLDNRQPCVNDYSSQIDHQNELINTYLNDLIVLKEQLCKEQKMNKTLTTLNNDFQTTVSNQKQTIDMLTKKLEHNCNINSQVDELVKDKQKIKSDIDELTKDKNTYNLKLGEALKEKTKINLQLSELLKEKKLSDNLQEEINKLAQTGDDTFKSQIDKLVKNKDMDNKLNSKIYELTQSKDTLRVQINDFMKEKTKLNHKLNDLNKNKQSKNAQIDELLSKKHNFIVPQMIDIINKTFDIQLNDSLKGFKINESTKTKTKISHRINEILHNTKLNE
jgi:chromosome segregation ATPase